MRLVPDFRDPAPPPRPLPTQTPATATSANPSATNNNTNNILPRRGRRPNRKWSGHEVRWLVAGIREFGAGNWASILSRYPFEGRTGVDLKDKFRNLLKYGTEEEIIRQQKIFTEFKFNSQVEEHVLHHHARPPMRKDFPPKLYNIITSCWNADASQRPSAQDVVEIMNSLTESDLV